LISKFLEIIFYKKYLKLIFYLPQYFARFAVLFAPVSALRLLTSANEFAVTGANKFANTTVTGANKFANTTVTGANKFANTNF
jgi:hypothetical protein